ncbi:MAG: glycosyltransferase family 2 protein [Pseudomonadota bacterium]
MKLVMTLLVRDEADIVRHNLEFHYAQGVDHVIAMDNNSLDGTDAVLEEYAREGRLTLHRQTSDEYRQSEWVTAMAMEGRARHGADWILANDADEFYRPSQGTLKDVLAASGERLLDLRRYNMVSSFEALARRPWEETLIWRSVTEAGPPMLRDIYADPFPRPFFCQKLPGKVVMPARGLVRVEAGQHGAAYDPSKPAEFSTDITVYHFPIRRLEPFLRKNWVVGRATEEDAGLPPDRNWKTRRWYRMIEAGREDAVRREVLPSRLRLLRERALGEVVRDEALRRDFARLGFPRPPAA